jgi:hypothetical protein
MQFFCQSQGNRKVTHYPRINDLHTVNPHIPSPYPCTDKEKIPLPGAERLGEGIFYLQSLANLHW